MFEQLRIIFDSCVRATMDIGLIILPVGLYMFILLSIGKTQNWHMLPAWSFLSVALYSYVLRDVVNVFSMRQPEDTEEHLSIDRAKLFSHTIICIIGLTISTAQLTLSIIRSSDTSFSLSTYFDYGVLASILFGLVCVFIMRSSVYQRENGRFAR
ncbi:MAG: hypothetical protein JKY26_00070 [Pseudomonas sp.]|nr:hypothetical protein [Pseudomonas sp.]